MTKFVLSFSWQIDARLKNFKKDSFTVPKNKYGLIKPLDNPANDYYLANVQMLGVYLNQDTTRNLLSDLTTNIAKPTNVNIIVGYLGFLTIEVLGEYHYPSDINKDAFDVIENDMQKMADCLSSKAGTTLLDTILESIKDFFHWDKDFYYGRHKKLEKLLVENGWEDIANGNERYIFTYHSFTKDEEEASKIRYFCNMKDESFSINDNKFWQCFANHLWLTKDEPDNDIMHVLSFTPIAAAWEVLIFDVGVINYKYLLRLLTSKQRINNDIVRQIINRDNLLMQETSITLRDQSIDKNRITTNCRKEYNYESRKELFLKGQEALIFATNGIDSSSQSKSSKMMEIILTFLTAMSIYSVVCDAYSLLTVDQPISFHSFSSILFSVTTLLVLLFVLFGLKTKK